MHMCKKDRPQCTSCAKRTVPDAHDGCRSVATTSRMASIAVVLVNVGALLRASYISGTMRRNIFGESPVIHGKRSLDGQGDLHGNLL